MAIFLNEQRNINVPSSLDFDNGFDNLFQGQLNIQQQAQRDFEDELNRFNGPVDLLNTTKTDESPNNRLSSQGRLNLQAWNLKYKYYFTIERLADGSGQSQLIDTFELPINPQDLVVTAPFATNLQITAGGVLEEHNGIPLRSIRIRATTGFLPKRSQSSAASQPTALNSIFTGTFQQAELIRNSFSSLSRNVGSLFGNTSTAPGSIGQGQLEIGREADGLLGALPPEAVDPFLASTGYAQINFLKAFFERYAQLKNAPNGEGYRLYFVSPKDQKRYTVTPQTFEINRSVSSPMEYMYNINMLAWDTSDIRAANPEEFLGDGFRNSFNSLNSYQNAINTLRQFQQFTSLFEPLLSSVTGDIESAVLTPLRLINLSLKNTVGAAQQLYDMPSDIKDSLTRSLLSVWPTTKNQARDAFEAFDSGPFIKPSWSSFSSQISKTISTTTPTNPNFTSPLRNIVPTVGPGANPLDEMPIGSVPLTRNLQDQISDENTRASTITRDAVTDLLSQLDKISDSLVDQTDQLELTEYEQDVHYFINDTKTELYKLLAGGFFDNTQQEGVFSAVSPQLSTDALDFWSRYSATNDIPYSTPTAKIAIPLPFNSSLEQLAYTYLGDPNRWTEIASLNGLQSPYIDQDGFTRSFSANGSGNTFTVTSDENLFIGQNITIASDTQRSNTRKILAINEISNNIFLITLDGNDDLSSYTLAENAFLKAFLPNTVNSLQRVFIPSTETPPNDNPLSARNLTNIPDTIEDIKLSKIDILLTPDLDIALTSDGQPLFSFGTTNLIQASILKLKTARGSLPLHPRFGVGAQIGQNVAEFSVQQKTASIERAFLEDPRFESPFGVSFQAVTPNVLAISVIAATRQNGGVLPITVPIVTPGA